MWKFNLNNNARLEGTTPLGFDVNYDVQKNEAESVVSVDAELAAKQRQVMGIAYSPGKSLLTTAFMLYMSGTSIQIFSIMTTGMALINPLKAIASVDQTFGKFEGVDTKLAKLIFIALQLLAVGIALYNCSRMGLLPVTSVNYYLIFLKKINLISIILRY